MGDTKEQTLPDIFVKLHNWFHRIYTDEARDGEEISHSDAMVAIQSAIAEAIPEKLNARDGFPAEPKLEDFDSKEDMEKEDAIAIGLHTGRTTGFNEAIDQFTTNLKAKGLLR